MTGNIFTVKLCLKPGVREPSQFMRDIYLEFVLIALRKTAVLHKPLGFMRNPPHPSHFLPEYPSG